MAKYLQKAKQSTIDKLVNQGNDPLIDLINDVDKKIIPETVNPDKVI